MWHRTIYRTIQNTKSVLQLAKQWKQSVDLTPAKSTWSLSSSLGSWNNRIHDRVSSVRMFAQQPLVGTELKICRGFGGVWFACNDLHVVRMFCSSFVQQLIPSTNQCSEVVSAWLSISWQPQRVQKLRALNPIGSQPILESYCTMLWNVPCINASSRQYHNCHHKTLVLNLRGLCRILAGAVFSLYGWS